MEIDDFKKSSIRQKHHLSLKHNISKEEDSSESNGSHCAEISMLANRAELARRCDKLITFEMIVRDTGCGISAENQEKLFMNFSRIDETQKANPSGVGLGLSICRDIILALGG